MTIAIECDIVKAQQETSKSLENLIAVNKIKGDFVL
uniref:Uncharacterized protein n=1 Tax=virus sp. ctqEG8 TaxID=2827998 RepID=A0A8S5REP6_9VIRU|nr:MAG TPA: hypothetical protein [virus sp. ctqEG8]